MRRRLDKTQLVQKQVVIDENLSWKSHISYICKKVSKSTGIIFRCRYYLSTKTKLSLYYSLVYPYLTYCNIVWSSNYKTNRKRIYLLQKRVVRALTNSDFHAHTAPLFTQLKILNIYKINTFHVAKVVFLSPPFTSTIFSQLIVRNPRFKCEIHASPSCNVVVAVVACRNVQNPNVFLNLQHCGRGKG